MRWIPLARTECVTILTSKGSWALALLMILWGFRPTYLGWEELGANMTVGFLQSASTLLLPLGVFLLTYRAIVHERESGSLKFLLGLPLTRTEILLGKIAGRSAGLMAVVTIVGAAIALIGGIRFGIFSPVLFLALLAVTCLYVVVLTTISISVSAMTTSAVRATGITFGVVYLGLIFLWKYVATAIYTGLTGNPVDPRHAPADGLLFILHRLSPNGAYNVVTNWVLNVGNSAAGFNSVITKLRPGYSVNVLVVESAFEPEAVPIYLHESLGLLIMGLWIVTPLWLARFWFERGDLV